MLRDDDVRAFARDGYLVIPGVVPEPLLAAADAEIDALAARQPDTEHEVGTHGWSEVPGLLPSCDAVLRDSPALAIANELVAPFELDHALDHIQVATTVPSFDHRPGGPHLDGHAPGDAPPASFTLLAAVLLTDQTVEHSGNLWVWPGSHLDHQRLFRERGARALQPVFGHATLLDPPLALAPQIPVLGRRGDLLLAHYLLGHNHGGNVRDWVRRTIYYRLAVPGHLDRWEQTFLDPWTEYEPIASTIG